MVRLRVHVEDAAHKCDIVQGIQGVAYLSGGLQVVRYCRAICEGWWGRRQVLIQGALIDLFGDLTGGAKHLTGGFVEHVGEVVDVVTRRA